MSQKIISPRLHVILARESRTAVVIRRGPSGHTGVFGWNRAGDEIKVGQWMKGRIYERRCDLSPDGAHLLYFAANFRKNEETDHSWTAISRAPFLKAMALLAKGDCWHGGGLFLSDTRYWLNGVHTVVRDATGFSATTKSPGEADYGGECPGVYFIRLQRDGWRLTGEGQVSETESVTIFEKPLGHGLTLRKEAHADVTIPHVPGRGVYYDTHALVSADSGIATDHPDWEWADLDGERLVWAAGGCLFAAPLGETGPGPARLLHDFSTDKYEEIVAPY